MGWNLYCGGASNRVRHVEGEVKRWRKWIGGAVLLLAAVLQATNPAHTNPTVAPGHNSLATNTPPAPVAALLKQACYDCHSCETRWPWYSYVAPVSWSVAGRVNAAREALNFSEWPHDEPGRAQEMETHRRRRRIRAEAAARVRPWLHREARLDAGQRRQLAQWAEEEAKRLASAQ